MSKVQTYSEQAKAYIKQRLLDGSLSPGDPIKENEIASALGISRGPVREALQSLLRQGLVTGEPQKAKYIRKMNSREIEDTYCLGGTLEGACIAQSLTRFDDSSFDILKKHLEEMRLKCGSAKGLAEMSAIDECFHDVLLTPCSNRLMANLARNSCTHISKFLYFREWDQLFTPEEFYLRHKIIFEAVLSLNAELIQKTLLEHYGESGRRLGALCARDINADNG